MEPARRFVVPILPFLFVACAIGDGVPATRSFSVPGVRGLTNDSLLDLRIRRAEPASVKLTCDENLLDAFNIEVRGARLVIENEGPISPRVDCQAEVTIQALEGLRHDGSGTIEVVDAFDTTESLALQGSGDVWLVEGARGLELASLRGSGRLHMSVWTGCRAHLEVRGSGRALVDRTALEPYPDCGLTVAGRGSGAVVLEQLQAPSFAAALEGSGALTVAGRTDALSVEVTGSGAFRGRGLVSRSAEVVGRGSGQTELTAKERVRVVLLGSGQAIVHGEPPIRDLRATGSGTVIFR